MARWLLIASLLAGFVASAYAEQVLRRGNAVEPETLDPHKAEGTNTSHILRDIYEGLTAEAADGAIIPGAAHSWAVSEDGLTWRFELRQEGRWSNGDPVTADDFVRGLRRSVDPATGSNYSVVLTPLVNAPAVISGELPPEALGVSAPDSHTLILQLRSPTPYLLGLLTHSATYPIHGPSFDLHGERFARPGHLISNGAFELDDWVVQSHLSLRRNPHYWDAEAVRLDRVIYYPTENQAAELKRYRAGELDWTDVIPKNQIRWLREHLADELHISPYLGTYYYGLNLEREPFKDNPDLRLALSMALDRNTLTERITAVGELPAYSWVPPGVANYEAQPPEWAQWPRERQLAEARRLYQKAGYGPENPLQVELRYNTQQDHKKVAVTAAFMWREALGVEVTLINEEWKVFLQNRRFGKVTEIFRGAWISDYNDAFSFAELLLGGNDLNDTGYDNPEYNALIRAAAAEPDPAQRRAMLEQAERVMLADQPLIPVYFYVNARLVKPWVKGWQDNIMDHHSSRHLWIEGRP